MTDRRLPAGSWDTHCHVFGPAELYPWSDPRPYTPEERPRDMLFEMHRSIGVDRAVIVHPACHGFDMSVTLDAIAASDGRYRGIALVPDDIDTNEIARLHEGGIRGIRFNYVRRLGSVPAPSVVLDLADRIAPFGWHIVLHFDPDDMMDFEPLGERLEIPFVIDHFGRVTTDRGLDQPPFRALLRLAKNPLCWVKISAADRASREAAPYLDTLPFAHALLEQGAERILWATDWPHPGMPEPLPREDDLIDLLHLFVPDESVRHRILVDHPNALYGV